MMDVEATEKLQEKLYAMTTVEEKTAFIGSLSAGEKNALMAAEVAAGYEAQDLMESVCKATGMKPSHFFLGCAFALVMADEKTPGSSEIMMNTAREMLPHLNEVTKGQVADA